MKEFIEKWKSDSRFRTKVKLGLYTAFVIFVAIFAFSTNPNVSLNGYETEGAENSNQNQEEENNITLEDEYSYKINLTINNDNYQFEGSKTKEKEIIRKSDTQNETNYIYEKNNYYKEESGVYIMTTKEAVYEPIKEDYIKIDTINQYLSKSKKEKDKYVVYLKDIILGNNSDEFISIAITKDDINNKKNINIDYTMLMKHFDDTIENYVVNIEIE